MTPAGPKRGVNQEGAGRRENGLLKSSRVPEGKEASKAGLRPDTAPASSPLYCKPQPGLKPRASDPAAVVCYKLLRTKTSRFRIFPT